MNKIYDNDTNDTDKSYFREKVLNHENLYFVIIDTNNNIFCHYNKGKITNTNTMFQKKKQ